MKIKHCKRGFYCSNLKVEDIQIRTFRDFKFFLNFSFNYRYNFNNSKLFKKKIIKIYKDFGDHVGHIMGEESNAS